MIHQELTKTVIGCAIEVHRSLGPGLLESTYQTCLMHELQETGVRASEEVYLPVMYKGLELQSGYRLDIVVEEKLILELKCVDALLPIHEAQLITYLKISGISVGLLMNFNSTVLHKNMKRFMV